MTDTTKLPESNQDSQPLTLQAIMSGQQPAATETKTDEVKVEDGKAKEGEAGSETTETKAPGEETKVETKTEDPLEAEKAALKKRVDDTQRWGQSQRSAVLTMIKNLKESGVEEDEIKKLVGGEDVYTKVLQNIPVEQHLQNDDVVMQTAFNNTVAAAEAVLVEQGETPENLKKYFEAFNAVGFGVKEHRDEILRRATSGGSVAAYIFKHGKELLGEYDLHQQVRQKGLSGFLADRDSALRASLEQELSTKKNEQNAETKTTPKKPELVGGSPAVEVKTNNDSMTGSKSIKDIMGR